VPSAVRLGFLDWWSLPTFSACPRRHSHSATSAPASRFPLLDADQIVFVGAVPDELTDWEKRTVAASALPVIWVDEVKENPARPPRRRSPRSKTESTGS